MMQPIVYIHNDKYCFFFVFVLNPWKTNAVFIESKKKTEINWILFQMKMHLRWWMTQKCIGHTKFVFKIFFANGFLMFANQDKKLDRFVQSFQLNIWKGFGCFFLYWNALMPHLFFRPLGKSHWRWLCVFYYVKRAFILKAKNIFFFLIKIPNG